MSKKLSVYLYSTEEADSTDATVISFLDCGNSGERYKQALKLLDADEAAIGEFFDAYEHDGELSDIEGYQMYPGKKGQKIDINVRDEENDKNLHTSTITFQEDIYVLADKIDSLAFAEDFPQLLKEQILDVIAKHKDNPGSLPHRVANCATYFPLNHYRAMHPEVTDSNIFAGRIQHVGMDNMCFKIELEDTEKFDKKKLYLFGFEWMGGNNITPTHSWSAYTMTMCPLLLYGNTLYYGYMTGEWEFDTESIKRYYGLFKFKENKSDYTFGVTSAGFGEPLSEGKDDFLEDNTKIKEKAERVEDDAYAGDTDLTSFDIPDTVIEIGWNAFKGCVNLASVSIPKSVTEIGTAAFEGCKSLVSLTFPDSVIEIGSHAFENCSQLETMILPPRITCLELNAFMGCKSLKKIVIPSSVSLIESQVFKDCTSLGSVTIEGPVEKIGDNVFDGCTSLKTITLPAGIKKISKKAFEGCTAIERINVPAKKADYYKKRLPENLHAFIVEQ